MRNFLNWLKNKIKNIKVFRVLYKFSIRNLAAISYVMAFISVVVMLFVFFGIDVVYEKANASAGIASWFQAVGSVLAIVGAWFVSWWQYIKNKRSLDSDKLKDQINLCHICDEMCDALLSIVDRKFGSYQEIHNVFKNFLSSSSFLGSVFKTENVRLAFSVDNSQERIYDLQLTLRALIGKDLPVDLMRSIFYLQKSAAQYKSFVDQISSGDGSTYTLDTKEIEYINSILKSVGEQKKKIDEFKNKLDSDLERYS